MAFLHDPTFAVLVAFIIFIGLLFKPAKKALTGSLDAKIAKIKSEVDEAQELREITLKRQEQQAQEKIAQAEANALREIRDQAIDIAIAATSQLLTEKLSGQAGDALISQSIRDLPGRLH